ncbi:MAG: glucose-6-phosphate isomerase, partial [Desulfobacterales bacterium]
MSGSKPNQTSEWTALEGLAERMNLPDRHLRHLLEEDKRLERFSLTGGGLFYDFSRQRVDGAVLDALHRLASKAGLLERFAQMAAGEKVNVTENRAALHTAARSFSSDPVTVDGKDVMPALRAEREKIRAFSEKIRAGEIVGAGGRPFTDAVVIGIGGSYLGTEFVSRALAARTDGLRLHFLANVDVHNFGRI